ncbi:MAG: FHA domain-containing protein [Polyangiaceae bacterium]
MGILERLITKKRCSLAAQSTIGRSSDCVLKVDDLRVSATHAKIAWSAERAQWEVRDLRSSNGTTVDGRKLAPNDRVPLKQGSELRLGSGEVWVLVSDLPPVACATGPDGQTRAADSGMLELPDDTKPLACVLEDSDGVWWVEIGDDEARLAVDQETIVAGEPWVLSIPPVPQSSVQTTVRVGRAMLFDLLTFRFRHSADEEHIEWSIVNDGDATTPIARVYLYPLLTLARARVRDRDAGIAVSEQGWLYVEDLRAMLRMDAEKLNVDIHRARKDLLQLGVTDFGSIVERRSASRQIRLGTDRVEIEKM